MEVNKGLQLDGTYLDKELGKFNHAKNIVLSKGKNGSENEPGFNLSEVIDGDIIGVCEAPETTVIFSKDGNFSEIGIFDGTTYTIKLKTQYLEFNINNPIRSQYTYNYKNELIVAWCDGIEDNSNEIRILNLDNIPFDLDGNLELISASNIKHTYLFPETSNIKIDLASVNDGAGLLDTGVYYFSVANKTKDGTITEFSQISNPVSVIVDNMSDPYNFTEGSKSGIRTNKSITLNLSGLSEIYSELVIGVIYKESGSLSAKITRTIEYSGTSKSVTIFNLNSLYDYDLNEILSNKSVYPKCEDISSNHKRLIIGNLTGLPDINEVGQEIANNVKVKWANPKILNYSENVNDETYKDPQYVFYNKHFRYGEVYALYLGLRSTKGGYIGIWHIPGRQAKAGEIDTLSDHSLDNLNPGNIKRFQVEDTSSGDTGGADAFDLGYWENEGEYYRSTFPDFAGQPVRHHKMPNLNRMLAVSNPGSGSVGSAILDPQSQPTSIAFLKFQTSNTNLLYKATISNGGFTAIGEIETVIGTDIQNIKYIATEEHIFNINLNANIGLLKGYNEETSEWKPNLYFYIKINKYNSDDSLNETVYQEVFSHETQSDEDKQTPKEFNIDEEIKDVVLLEGQYLQVEGFSDLGYDGYEEGDPADDDSYVEVSDLGVSYSENIPDITEGHILLGLNLSNINIPVGIRDFVDGWELFYAKRNVHNSLVIAQSPLIPEDWDSNSDLIANTPLRFHAFDLMLTKMNVDMANYFSIEAKLFTTVLGDSVWRYTDIMANNLTESKLIPLVNGEDSKKYIPVDNEAANNYGGEGHVRFYIGEDVSADSYQIFLANLCSYKTSLYTNYVSQHLVSTGYIGNNTTTSKVVMGGDAFFNRYSFRLTKSDIENPDSSTYRLLYVLTESANNIDLRMEGDLDEHIFYPKSSAEDVVSMAFDFDNFINTATGIGYNYDFTSINDIRNHLVNSPRDQFVDTFPNRFAISLPYRSESTEMSWRKFRLNDYRDMDGSRGAIKALNSLGRIMYIQQEFSLFTAYPKEVLSTLTQDAHLREEDILDREPEEVVTSKNGYIGCKSKFSTLICLYGYIVIDASKRAIFFIQEQPLEISNIDAQEWFYNNMLPLDTYNPFISTGSFISFDEHNKRFILTYKGTEKEFSMSFSIETLIWYCFHDYVPDYSFVNNLTCYYIKNYANNNNRIFQSNRRDSYGIYLYDGDKEDAQRHPLFVDIIINPELEMSKLIQNIFWHTVVKENNRVIYNDTFNKIMVYNETQCTGLLDVNIAQMWYDTEYGVYINDIWYFNEINDNVVDDQSAILDEELNPIEENVSKNLKNWFEISKFICKFVVVRLLYNNTHGRYFLIRSIDATMIKDNR